MFLDPLRRYLQPVFDVDVVPLPRSMAGKRDAQFELFRIAQAKMDGGRVGRGRFDANAIQLAREGVAAGLLSIPNRYMHSPVEVVSLKDLDNAAKLLAEFCLSVTSDANWIP